LEFLPLTPKWRALEVKKFHRRIFRPSNSQGGGKREGF